MLDSLNKIKWHEDGTLTYRRSCAHGICGSDAMRINGRNRLACKVLMGEVGDRVTIEPLLGFSVIKDLVVDMESFFAGYKSIKPYLITHDENPSEERRQSPEERARFDDTTKCILCASCTTACPITWTNEEWVGPAAIVNAHRFIYDSRDQGGTRTIADSQSAFRSLALPDDFQLHRRLSPRYRGHQSDRGSETIAAHRDVLIWIIHSTGII